MSFTLYLNSERGVKTTIGSTQSVEYTFNWSVLEENSEYELTFTYACRDVSVLTADDHYAIRIRGLGALNNNYTPTSSSVASSNQIIGMIHPETVVNKNGNNIVYTNYLYADTVTNPPVFIRQKPTGNTFRVEIVFLDDIAIPVLTDEWVLILHFKKVKE